MIVPARAEGGVNEYVYAPGEVCFKAAGEPTQPVLLSYSVDMGGGVDAVVLLVMSPQSIRVT